MSEEIKFDHFKNINELLQHIDIWYKEDDIDYTRWFHLEDLKKVKDYIVNLKQENKQLKEDLRVSQSNEETYCLEMQEITKILGLDEHTLFDDVKYYAKELKEEKPYLYTNTAWEDVLEYRGNAYVEIEKLKESYNYREILTELEEWLKEELAHEEYGRAYKNCLKISLDKIQELKEKYK